MWREAFGWSFDNALNVGRHYSFKKNNSLTGPHSPVLFVVAATKSSNGTPVP